MAIKIRDCVECADQHYTKDMYPHEGSYICEQCFHDTFTFDKSDEVEIQQCSMNAQRVRSQHNLFRLKAVTITALHAYQKCTEWRISNA